MMKRLLLGVSLVALSAGAAMAAPAVVETGVNLRSGPGTEYAVIDTMPAGARVDAISCSSGWCRVDYQGVDGYASRAYLDIETAGVPPDEYYPPSYAYYGYYEPGLEYYEPGYVYGFGAPYESFGFGFVGHRHEHRFAERHQFSEPHEFIEQHEFAAHHELGERGFSHAMAPKVGRAQFARSFAAYRGAAPAAHFQAAHIGGTMGLGGHAMPGGFGGHMAAIGHIGGAGIGSGHPRGGGR